VIEPYRAPPSPSWIGDAAFAVALLALVYFLHLARVLRVHERDTWWASNGRDAVNALAVVTLFGAISLQGFSLPLSLLFAATITLILTVLYDALATRFRHPGSAVLVAAAIVGAPLVLAPARVAALVAGGLARAFGAAP
jgi:hypothetical protein